MKPCQLSTFLSLICFLSTMPVFAENERGIRHKFKQLETQLGAARESMHQAQRELAKKAEHIQKLERQIKTQEEGRKKSDASGVEKMRAEMAALRKTNGEMARELADAKKKLAERQEVSKGMQDAKKSKPTAKSRPESIVIRYEEKSAATYEGREKVLKWIETQMKKGEKKFKIEGAANDSEYAEANEVIAKNRARYLADYLVLKGIPKNVLSVSASPSDAQGEKGRTVVVSTMGR